MSITTASDLESAIANWLMRPGDTDITGNAADFITFCEARIHYGSDDPQFPSPPLRVSNMETVGTVTTTSTTNLVALPTDFLELRNIYLTTDPVVRPEFMTPAGMDMTFMSSQPGEPITFCIIGGNLRFGPNPDTAYTVNLDYYQKLSTLSGGGTATNWLLTASPAIYLNGCLLEASIFTGDDAGAAKYARLFAGHLSAFQKQDQRKKFGAGPMRIMTDTGNP